MSERNVIIAGVPRSGTTLACHLLNKVENTVALNEPFRASTLSELGDNDAICRKIAKFFKKSRASLLADGTAVSKSVDGAVPDNIIGSQYGEGGVRTKISNTKGVIHIGKPLTGDFHLCIKQVAIFVAILDSLVKHFSCFAVMRNPLGVLMSWNSIVLPYRKGRVKQAEILNQNLADALDRIEDTFDRQIFLLSWFYETINKYIAREAVIHYEDMIKSGGKALRPITPEAATLNESLESRNSSKLYDPELKKILGEKLLKSDGTYWEYYSKESVETLLKSN